MFKNLIIIICINKYCMVKNLTGQALQHACSESRLKKETKKECCTYALRQQQQQQHVMDIHEE